MWYTLEECSCTDGKSAAAIVSAPADSPLFDGHFPGDPVLPGIGQLAMVADILGRLTGKQCSVTKLRRVKFRRKIERDEQLAITITTQKNAMFAFRVTTGKDNLVCSGLMAANHNGKAKEQPRP